jgi:hypothetical protein
MPSNVIRGCIAVFLLAGLAAWVGNDLFPDVPTWKVVLYASAGAGAAFFVILAATVASLQVGQIILRKGGTDAQWLSFPSEPAGLVALRAEERAEAHAARQAVVPAER